MPRTPILLALALAGCEPSPLALVTYNAGLAVGFVPASEDRAAGTIEAIAALEDDVVCVQEIWLPEHVAMLEAAAAERFPHAYFPDAQPVTLPEPACTEEGIAPLVSCLDEKCGDVCVDELADCALASCALDYLRLDRTCQGCVQANVGGEAEQVRAACTTGTTLYAYGGSFGTGLLSAHPIRSVEEHVFESTTNRRSALHAVIGAPKGDVDVLCTHLTAVFSVIPYPRESGSWAEEQAAQIDALMALADQPDSGRVAVLGDLNTGPSGDEIVAKNPDNWALVAGAGLDAPYRALDGRCTFCADNPLVASAEDVLIDHVLLGGFEGESTAERILDARITALSCGAEIPAAHSDHYGVRVTVSP